MDPTGQPDSYFRPAPGLDAPGAPPRPPGQAPPGEAPTGDAPPGVVRPGDAPPAARFPLGASKGLIGLLVAMAGILGVTAVVAIAFTAAGAETLKDNYAFAFVATFAGDLALVAAAIGMTAEAGRPSARTFGFRRFRVWSALGWVVLAFLAYLILAGIYTELVNPPPDDLPNQLGADQSTFLAVMTGVFVIAVAPFAEEFFFRGFLFQALRNSWGPLLGALGSAAIFSAIHLAPDKFVQLSILGLALAFLFQKTDSIWPCIMLHAMNNVIAFAVTL
jgi:hypothetical protein